ncbi:MAG: hypothetical protein QOI05_2325 [Bradyrhizobium sp.]|jgi:hypothetical protein|nr:hypothetical protein [Bradyrhizobium sp.]
MSVDGNWKITMSTPMGERNADLTLQSSGGTLTGTQGADGQSGAIFDGTVDGDNVAWKISITNPMPLTLAFTGKVTGDTIAGDMGIGPMGSFPFKGVRA